MWRPPSHAAVCFTVGAGNARAGLLSQGGFQFGNVDAASRQSVSGSGGNDGDTVLISHGRSRGSDRPRLRRRGRSARERQLICRSGGRLRARVVTRRQIAVLVRSPQQQQITQGRTRYANGSNSDDRAAEHC